MPYASPHGNARYYQENKKRLDKYSRKWRADRRNELIAQLGGKCAHCGEIDPIVLDFDHIEEDGHKERGYHLAHRVAKEPHRFQLLCKNCNWRKEHARRNKQKHAIGSNGSFPSQLNFLEK